MFGLTFWQVGILEVDHFSWYLTVLVAQVSYSQRNRERKNNECKISFCMYCKFCKLVESKGT